MPDRGTFDEAVERLTVTIAGLAQQAPMLLAAASRCAEAMRAGGTLWVDATADARPHAEHVAVEFVHPVITGKRAVPALVVAAGEQARMHPDDLRIWMGFGPDPRATSDSVDLWAIVDGLDPTFRDLAVVISHHLLWEIAHALVGGSGPESYLSELSATPHREVTEQNITDKITSSTAVITATLTHHSKSLQSIAAMIHGSSRTSRVWVLGQGGSAADAALAARLLGGTCLSANPAVLTALVNDIGPSAMYVRQVHTHVSSEDLVIALTTSGSSAPVLAALEAAESIGARTVACTGASGLASGGSTLLSNTLVIDVASDSIHRIQEAHLAVVGMVAAVGEAP